MDSWRDGHKVLGDIQTFFDGLGMQMANVITLVVAGQTFAKGLVSMGAITTLIDGSKKLRLRPDGYDAGYGSNHRCIRNCYGQRQRTILRFRCTHSGSSSPQRPAPGTDAAADALRSFHHA